MTTEQPLQPWTVDDILDVQVLSDAQIAPDGTSIAFCVRRMWKEGTAAPQSRIWLVDAGGEETQQFTQGPRTDHAPRWSPDGRTLAFLADRDEDGRFDIYLLPRAGGEARRFLDLEGSVEDIQWSPDGQQIAFIMTDPEPEAEKQRKEAKDDAIEFERAPRYQRLWVADVDGSGLRLVTAQDKQIWEFAWLPDGQRFALICSDLPYEWDWYHSSVSIISHAGGTLSTLYRSERQVALPVPSPDGQRIAFAHGIWSDRGVVAGDIAVVPADGGEAAGITMGYPASISWVSWLDARQLVAIGYEDGKGAIFQLGLDSPPQMLWSAATSIAERQWPRASITADRTTLALILEDYTTAPDVWTATVGQDHIAFTQHTRMSYPYNEHVKGTSQTVRWTATDGTPIQGILITPVGYEPGTRYPLVTIVHGGPTGLHAYSYLGPHWTPILAANGFAVLLPNPRGSTGWGSTFAEANLGDMGGQDMHDILAGIDVLVERGIADPERLGIGGWSYGGFMTAWVVTQTDRFKAAIMGAGIANWRSFHGVSNLPTWDRLFYPRADPYEMGSDFDRFSPVLQIDKAHTPTLIMHGEADAFVPVGQGYEFFRALKEHDIPTELVVYPREGHGIMERAHFRHLLDRMLAWYQRYLQTP